MLLLFFFGMETTKLNAQWASNVTYPVASCVGGGCPFYTSIPTYISASYFDTIHEVIYVGGPFNDMSGSPRNGLAAIDAITGNLLSWAPIVNNGIVKAIAKSGDTIFIGGTFSQINGQARGRIAALSASTGLLFSTFSIGTASVNDTIMSIKVFGKYIYVGGKFSTILSVAHNNIAKITVNGVLSSWNPAPAISGTVKKIISFTNRIAAWTDNYSSPCSNLYAIDTASSAVSILRAQTDPSLGFISDFSMRGNLAFIVGPFLSMNSHNLSYATACDLSTGIFTTWNPVIPIFNWDMRSRLNIEYYRDSLFIGVFDASSNLPAYHQLYVSYYNSPNNIRVLKTYQSNLIGIYGYYNDNLLVGNARLFEVERYTAHASSATAVDCHFFSYCLRPPNTPGPFSIAPTPVCPGDSNVIYKVVPLGYFNSYIWTDNNINVFASGTTNAGSVDFNENYSGSVTIRAYGVTSCGTVSPSFRSTIVFSKPTPNANAGLDDSLNCIISQLTLLGTSTTLGATFVWNGPNNSFGNDSIVAFVPGSYELIVHGPNGCWKRDTAIISLDTIPPAILPFGNVPVLTCQNTISVLDASVIYPNDSLYWTSPMLSSHVNPAMVTQSDNYLLTVTNRNNGCSDTTVIFVPQNVTPPSANIIASDTILTCSIQNILLSGNSSTPNVTYQWTDTSGTYFQNPYSISIPGIYFLHAMDTMNGCDNIFNQINITSWTTPPGIVLLIDTISLNCSYSSLPLNAASLTSSAILNWTGPNAYASANPGSATQLGNYFVTATNPQNGCSSIDSIFVDFRNTLIVNSGNDTSICFGSGAVLQAIPIGGTPSFDFTWNNAAGNSSLVTVYPNDTLMYIVNVTDGAGCMGSDTIIVNVPDAIADSVLSFQPCDPLQATGQIQIYAYAGVPPFQYSKDNGLSWNSTGIFSNLPFGNYNFLIQDFLGCTRNEIASIDTNSLSPTPQFLVCSGPQQGDTIVVVDISNPRPDSVRWDFPLTTTLVDSNMFAPAFINMDTGAFIITMHAFYGDCEVIYSRTIIVHPFDSSFANQWNNNGIDSISLYPNPNNGIFNLGVTLFAKQNFVILVYDANGIEKARQQVYDADNWNGQMAISNPVPGNYVLRVIAEFDSKQKVFVITQ
ncbi:MAG: T9SS type A sorting domain-containing protein [Bacteroidetes bacterium]|nr:T9SS type A sorting domain-containing protein [Bacteroidota bacterium]